MVLEYVCRMVLAVGACTGVLGRRVLQHDV